MSTPSDRRSWEGQVRQASPRIPLSGFSGPSLWILSSAMEWSDKGVMGEKSPDVDEPLPSVGVHHRAYGA